MDFLDYFFIIYLFIGLYIISLLLFIYFPNRKKIFEYPKSYPEKVSIIIPSYNEGKTIGNTLKHILDMNYPKKMIEIIVVDDCSTDNSVQIVKEYARKYKNIKLLQTKRNSGCAAVPTNLGVKNATSKYVIVLDADSYPDKDSLNKMIGFLQEDQRVAAVTPAILTRSAGTLMQKMQHIEYDLTAVTRKLLDMVDSVYVTPGAFALYRKSALIEVGLFDQKNLTQDIEIVWRLLSKGYKVKMCFAAKAHTETPSTFKLWWAQRNRWNIGGYQTLNKYKSSIFRKGMLGNFIIPYFAFSLILALLGLATSVYIFLKNIITYSLALKYALYASASPISLQQLALAPSIITFFGMALFILGIGITFFFISIIKSLEPREGNVLNILFYLVIYSLIYPLVTISSLFRIIRNKRKW